MATLRGIGPMARGVRARRFVGMRMGSFAGRRPCAPSSMSWERGYGT